MGCFDTVNFKCPKCGSAISIQSKAGACALKTFKANAVPCTVAEDLDGYETTCGCCSKRVEVYIPEGVPRVIAMEVRAR